MVMMELWKFFEEENTVETNFHNFEILNYLIFHNPQNQKDI